DRCGHGDRRREAHRRLLRRLRSECISWRLATLHRAWCGCRLLEADRPRRGCRGLALLCGEAINHVAESIRTHRPQCEGDLEDLLEVVEWRGLPVQQIGRASWRERV